MRTGRSSTRRGRPSIRGQPDLCRSIQGTAMPNRGSRCRGSFPRRRASRTPLHDRTLLIALVHATVRCFSVSFPRRPVAILRLRTSGRPARRQNELCTAAFRGPRSPCRLRSTPHLRHRRDDGGRFAPHADRHRWRNGRRPIVVRRAADRPAGHRHPSGPAADAGRPGSCIQDGGTSATNPCRARDHCTVPTSATGWLR